MFVGPKPDPARKLGSPIRPKTRSLKKKNQEVNRNKLVNWKVLILKPPLMNRLFKIGILMNHQKPILPCLTLNQQLQTGLVR